MLQPNHLTVDAAGNIYIAETGNHVVRKVSTAGVISLVAGTSVSGYSGDGGQATAAMLADPAAVCFDAAGNLYIAELGNSIIRKVSTSGIISTFAGNGTAGFAGDGGPATAANLDAPFRMIFSAAGDLYIADASNNRIRKVNTAGVISTFAGNGVPSYTGNGGPATGASLNFPIDVAFDNAGNLFIADIDNNVVRKVDGSGIISTIAGTGALGYSGDGGQATAATLRYPYAICVDNANNIYITDNGNAVIRRINIFGTIKTIVGNGAPGYSGNGGPATAGQVLNPGGVVTDLFGNLFIADFGNNVIRKVTDMGLINGVSDMQAIAGANFSVYPNPATNMLNVDMLSGVSTGNVVVEVCSVFGSVLAQETMCGHAGASVSFNIRALPPGAYFVTIKTNGQQYTTKVVKE